MAGQSGRIPAAENNCEQEEVEEIAALSPRTSTVRLLAVLTPWGDLHDKMTTVMDSLDTLTRRMDGLPAPARIEDYDQNRENKGGDRRMPHCDTPMTTIKKTTTIGRTR